MADVLGSGLVALNELRRLIRRELRDEGTSSTGKRWDDDEVDSAIRHAIAQASNLFVQSGRYDLDYAAGTLDYTLPDYVQNVRRIQSQKSVYPTASVTDYETVANWRHYPGMPGDNMLRYTKDRATATHRIYYDRDVEVPTAEFTLSAAVDSTAGTFAFATGSDAPWIREIRPIAYYRVDNEISKVTEIAAANEVTVSRGTLNTAAASHATGATAYPIIAVDDDRFYTFVVLAASAWLSRSVLHDTGRGAEVAGTLTALRSYEEQIKQLRKDIKPRRTPRRVQFSRIRKR